MDKTSKKFKIWRRIGLIALTLAVIGAIVLTIVLVQKQGEKNLVSVDMGRSFRYNDEIEFVVSKITFTTQSSSIEIEDGSCLATVEISAKALKNFTLSQNKFRLNSEKSVLNNFSSKMTLKEGETKVINIGYIVKNQSSTNLYLAMFGHKVNLGTSMQGKPIL